MSDQSGGPGWWQASDDRWYPPELHPDYRPPASPPPPPPPAPPVMRPASTPWAAPPIPPVAAPPPAPPTVAQKPWYRRTGWVVTWVVLGLVVVLAAVGAAFGEDDEPKPVIVGRDDVPELTTTTEGTRYSDPVPSDFILNVVTTSKQCFGSAGCLLEIDVDLTYNGAASLDPEGSWTLLYEITGDESGPITKSITLRGDGQYTKNTTNLSTSGSSTVVSAAVTAVR